MKYTFGAVVGLVCLELPLRLIGLGDPPTVVLDEDIEYYLTPDRSFYRFHNLIRTNSYGMRSEDFDKDMDLDFLLLGDSVVYGNHFIDQTDTIAANLEREINPEVPVAAIAASSWGPANIMAYIDKFGPFDGRYAVVVQSSHDRTDFPFRSQSIIPYRKGPPYLAIFDAGLIVLERLARRLDRGQDTAQGASIPPETQEELRQVLQYLRSHFTQVLLIHHPTAYEASGAGDETEPEAYLRGISESLSIDFIPARLYYQQNCPVDQMYQDNIHPNPIGTACLAGLIYDWVGKSR